MKLNRQISITILLSMSVFLIISMVASVYSLNTLKNTEIDKMRETLLTERKNKLRDVVSNAYSVLETANFYEPAQKAISKMRFGENRQNYFYILDLSGIFWVNPARPELVGKDGSILKDASNSPYISKIINSAYSKGQGFLEFDAIKPETGQPSRKLVHFQRFEGWEWVVCADIFIDDIDNILLSNQKEIENAMTRQIIFLAVLGVLAFLLTATISSLFFRKNLVMPLTELAENVDQIAGGNFDVQITARSSAEINRLADAVERMRNSFVVAYRRLRSATQQLNASEIEEDELPETKGLTKFRLKNAG